MIDVPLEAMLDRGVDEVTPTLREDCRPLKVEDRLWQAKGPPFFFSESMVICRFLSFVSFVEPLEVERRLWTREARDVMISEVCRIPPSLDLFCFRVNQKNNKGFHTTVDMAMTCAIRGQKYGCARINSGSTSAKRGRQKIV